MIELSVLIYICAIIFLVVSQFTLFGIFMVLMFGVAELKTLNNRCKTGITVFTPK